jgi:hypothetical protein
MFIDEDPSSEVVAGAGSRLRRDFANNAQLEETQTIDPYKNVSAPTSGALPYFVAGARDAHHCKIDPLLEELLHISILEELR